MKKMILVLIAASLSFACNHERERIDQNKLDRMLERQRVISDKTGQANVVTDHEYVSVSGYGSGVDSDQNVNGLMVIGGERGIWLAGVQIGGIDVADPNSDVAVAINNNGDIIAAGNLGVFVKTDDSMNNRVLRSVELGTLGSKLSVDISDNKNWIAVGNKAVFVNGQRLLSVDVGGDLVDPQAYIYDNGTWEIISNTGRTSGTIPNDVEPDSSADDSSPQ